MRELLLILLSYSFPAAAYFSTIDSGDIPAENEYRLTLAPQFILSNGSGVNLTTHFDAGVSDSGAIRFLVGAGSIDFHTGLFYKWIPIPDIDGQPALGLKAGVIWARDSGTTIISSRLHPLISKRFENNLGDFNIYGSIPVGITAIGSSSAVPVQLVVGAEWKTLNYNKITFGAELGLNIDESFSYLTIFTSLYFDEEKGIKFE